MTIPRISKKKLAKLGGKPCYSTITASRIAPRRTNPKRKASEFKRCYGSKRRVEFVKGLPCAACRVRGLSENAHVCGNDGMGRKGDSTTVAPLCGRSAPREEVFWTEYVGCHTLYDKHRWLFDKRFPSFNSEQAARQTEIAWQKHLTGESNDA